VIVRISQGLLARFPSIATIAGNSLLSSGRILEKNANFLFQEFISNFLATHGVIVVRHSRSWVVYTKLKTGRRNFRLINIQDDDRAWSVRPQWRHFFPEFRVSFSRNWFKFNQIKASASLYFVRGFCLIMHATCKERFSYLRSKSPLPIIMNIYLRQFIEINNTK
jgi:hypothetical protein